MADKDRLIVEFDDGDTWSLATGVCIARLNAEQYRKLEEGCKPKHLEHDKVDLLQVLYSSKDLLAQETEEPVAGEPPRLARRHDYYALFDNNAEPALLAIVQGQHRALQLAELHKKSCRELGLGHHTVRVELYRRAGDAAVLPNSEIDIEQLRVPMREVQPIGKIDIEKLRVPVQEMQEAIGVGNLEHITKLELKSDDPPGWKEYLATNTKQGCPLDDIITQLMRDAYAAGRRSVLGDLDDGNER